jgi:HEAT repeat protein
MREINMIMPQMSSSGAAAPFHIAWIAATVLGLAAPPLSAQFSTFDGQQELRFQEARSRLVVDDDASSAIEIYESIVDDERASEIEALALLELHGLYLGNGQSARAREALERVLKDYSDIEDAAERAEYALGERVEPPADAANTGSRVPLAVFSDDRGNDITVEVSDRGDLSIYYSATGDGSTILDSSAEISALFQELKGRSVAAQPTTTNTTASIDRSTILVYASKDPDGNDELTLAAAESAATLRRRIDAERGLRVVDPPALIALRRIGYSESEAARALGAGFGVEFRILSLPQPAGNTLMYEIYETQTERPYVVGGAGREGLSQPFIVDSIISHLRERALGEPNIDRPQYDVPELLELVRFDGRGSFVDRSAALSELASLASAENDYSAAEFRQLALAVGISDSRPRVRAQSWELLRQFVDPEVIDPAVAALATETDGSVRLALTKLLWDYSDTPRVRETLEQALQSAQSEEEKNRAAFGLLPLEERAQSRRNAFLDRSRPIDERLDRFGELQFAFGKPADLLLAINLEVANELLAIGASDLHRAHRAEALRYLRYSTTDKVVDPLLAMLRDEPDGYVRAAAVWALGSFVDAAGVREALEAAIENDTDRSVRFNAREALGLA